MSRLFILIALLVLSYCGSSHYSVRSAVQLKRGQLVIASSEQEKNQINLFEKNKNQQINPDKSALQSLLYQLNENNLAINNLIVLNDDSLAVVTEKSGLYILTAEILGARRYKPLEAEPEPQSEKNENPEGVENETEQTAPEETAEPDIISLAVQSDQLRSSEVFDIHLWNRSFYITYAASAGYGVTKCPLSYADKIKCEQLNRANSDLKSDYVVQVQADKKGSLWFRYDPSEEEGVSRLSLAGEWNHFTMNNSELGDSSVYLMRFEEGREGLKGDNLWFVSGSGLSRLQYAGANENWKLYGKKKSLGTTVTKLLGIEDWFTQVILDIEEVEILSNALLITNKNGLYYFTDKGINRFIPEDLGGLDKNRLDEMFIRDRYVALELVSNQTGREEVSFFLSLDLRKRKWRKVNLWKIRETRPKSVLAVPYTRSSDLLILQYHHQPDVLLLYDFKRAKVTKIVKNDLKKG